MNFILKDNIVYEDDNLLIVNKPRGLLLQQDGDNSHESLDKIVGEYLKMVSMPVHRLDKDTSGLCVFAKNKLTADEMGKVFNDHSQIEKRYITLVAFQVEEDGFVDAHLIKIF